MILLLSPLRVADGLRSGSLSETQKARLVLVGYVITLVLSGRSLAGIRDLRELIATGFYLVVVVSGFWGCFKANQQGDGRSFIERYVCLGVPLSIVVYGLYTLAYYGGFVVLRTRGYDAVSYYQAAQPYFMVLSLVTVVVFFAILRRLLVRVASATAV